MLWIELTRVGSDSSSNLPTFIDVSEYQGRVVKLTYKPTAGVNPATDETLFIIGKGVTFDTGGLNIKTGNNMVAMRSDKCEPPL